MNKYSLLDLLTKEVEFEEKKYKFNGVQIPMIQRDYAHGREGESEIRKRFLKAIFKSLENNNELELDFVYGAKKTIDNKELFIPLDGQQRLTTLFLLNWYIGNRELENERLNELRNALEKFSYATRATSDTFFNTLSKTSINFNEDPSFEIRNASWFFDSFELDPTVQSMLVMLDAIHSMYGNEKRNLYSSLDQIKFYILPLDGFDLTDELYIKMNARGKQLTHFENLKADLTKWIKYENNPFENKFNETVKFDDRPVKYYLCFELKLENHWINLFWKFSKKNEKLNKKIVDPYMMQFWNRYLLNTYIVRNELNIDELDNNVIFKELYGKEGDDSNFKYNNFESYKTILEDSNIIPGLERTFDNLSLYIDEINEVIKPNWDKNDKWSLFSDVITQRQRILFFAVTTYLELNTFELAKFKNWIRVVWNIIIDPDIRSVPKMIGAMKFIYQLAEHSNNINDFLKKNDSILFFSSSNYYDQLEEEHLKAILIDKYEELEISIIESESHPLFKGNIRFLLTNFNEIDTEYFRKIKDIAFDILKDNNLKDNVPDNYLWIRALLAKTPDIQLPITLSNGGFDHWRFLINGPLLKGMTLLIDEISYQDKTAKDCMKMICENYNLYNKESWVYPLVTWVGNNNETLLGNYSATRRIQKYDNYANDPEHVYLYNQTRWTEGNIILSNQRNEIVSAILKSSDHIKFTSEWHNIQNQFFRGWKIILNREIDDLNFSYIFDRRYLRIGIKETEGLTENLKAIAFNDDEIAKGWICRKKFNYEIIKLDQINQFIVEIEFEVFDLSNSNSLMSKITAKFNKTKILNSL